MGDARHTAQFSHAQSTQTPACAPAYVAPTPTVKDVRQMLDSYKRYTASSGTVSAQNLAQHSRTLLLMEKEFDIVTYPGTLSKEEKKSFEKKCLQAKNDLRQLIIQIANRPDAQAQLAGVTLPITTPHHHYKFERHLSDTNMGTVWLAKVTATGQMVVAKLSCHDSRNFGDDPKQEVETLRTLGIPGHPNLIKVLAEYHEDADPCWFWAILEFADQGDLFAFISAMHDDGKANLAMVREYGWQLAASVQYIHSQGIVHLDLKPENVLLQKPVAGAPPNHPLSLKLCDFGMAQKIMNPGGAGRLLRHRCGTLAYMAPEVYEHKSSYDGRLADAWSYGVVLFILVTGHPPFSKPDASDPRFKYIFGGRIVELIAAWKMQAAFCPELYDLLNKLLTKAESRINMDDVLNHPFFNNKRGGGGGSSSSSSFSGV